MTMPFDIQLSLSKLFWLVAEPASLLLSVWVAGCLILWSRWWRLGRALVCFSAALTVAIAIYPIGQIALRPIEDRFPPLVSPPPRVDGILVLGGVIDYYVIGKRGVPSSLLAAGSPRLDAFIELARRYPAAKHVFTGGSIELIDGKDTEADVVRRIFARIGLDTTRIIFEDQSRNTWENARLTLDLIKPEPEETWLLITSARHMPRAMGTFRKAGWPHLLAYPIDFATDPNQPFDSAFRLGHNLNFLSEAIREYVGLAYYYKLGRIDRLFPEPLPAPGEPETTEPAEAPASDS
ncbi:MAG: YdcF family protein [Rhodospirillales bacterium]|nr:YdcF family protein [Rhodospirillales bacterium]